MVKDKGALRPEIFNIKGWIQQENKDDEFTVEEKILAAGAEQAFWKTLKKHFESSIQQLEQINEAAISSGSNKELIGENAIVISLVKGVLNKIVNVVQDAKEALDERGVEK